MLALSPTLSLSPLLNCLRELHVRGRRTMRLGVSLPISGPLSGAEGIRRVAREAEALGYDAVWTSDHVVIPKVVAPNYPYNETGAFHLNWQTPFYDPIGTLGFLAGVTERVRLGVGVLVLPFRNAVATAKTLATIDDLSGGRLLLGIGVGWMPEEFATLGLPASAYAERGAITDETVAVFRAVWAEGPSSFHGKYYNLDRKSVV